MNRTQSVRLAVGLVVAAAATSGVSYALVAEQEPEAMAGSSASIDASTGSQIVVEYVDAEGNPVQIAPEVAEPNLGDVGPGHSAEDADSYGEGDHEDDEEYEDEEDYDDLEEEYEDDQEDEEDEEEEHEDDEDEYAHGVHQDHEGEVRHD